MSRTLKWIGIACLTIIMASLLVAGVNWVSGWLTKPAEVFGVENVENQWQFAYDTEEDLIASAIQICNAQDALSTSTSDWERQQRQTQLTARLDNYARISSDYNARLRDAFRAGLVKPPDVREKALVLNEAIDLVCE